MNLNRLWNSRNQRQLQRKNLRDKMVEVTCQRCGTVLARYPVERAEEYSNRTLHCNCPTRRDRIEELVAGANLGGDSNV